MARNPDKIISASRRTDIPAFYMDWFMKQIHLGFFNIKNPYTKTVKTLNLSEDHIHSIVFWSKNYDVFINTRAGEELRKSGFNLYFNFTINSRAVELERHLPPLKKRLNQLAHLAEEFGPETISWRFDPICFYRTQIAGPEKNNLGDFQIIARQAEALGIKKCVTSFCDHYAKIQKRIHFLAAQGSKKIWLSDPCVSKKLQVIHRMEQYLSKENIQLFLCCEKEIFQRLDENSSIQKNACIDGLELKRLYGGNPETRRDYGQRSKQGCKCTRSIDVGSYEAHPCFHNCLFCYANPDIDTQIKRKKIL